MIPLVRIRTAAAIPGKYLGKKKKDIDLALLTAQWNFQKDNSQKLTFNDSFWKDAKAQLKLESNGKCAYCEANTQVVAHGDVEHFRPKSIYWWLAYTYDNYLYACQICNQVYKGDRFPVLGAAMLPAPAVSDQLTTAELEALAGSISPDPLDTAAIDLFIAAHLEERPALLNPYLDHPANYFSYDADDTLAEVKVVPVDAGAKPYLEAAESFYGINRVELKTARYQVFKLFKTLKKALPFITDPATQADIQQQLNLMKSDSYLFAGMLRYFDNK